MKATHENLTKATVKLRYGVHFEALARFLEQLQSTFWLSKPSQRHGDPQIEPNPGMEMRHGDHLGALRRRFRRRQSPLHPL